MMKKQYNVIGDYMEKLKRIVKECIPYVIIISVVVLVRYFLITPVRVSGPSMKPTLKNGEIVLLEKVDKNYERFDIVVLKSFGERLIKRIIGLPGEYVEYKNSKLYINDKEVEEKFISGISFEDFGLIDIKYIEIPKDMYFVVGDNRNNSTDSRIIGLIKKEDIQGKVIFRLFPFNKIGKIKKGS